LELHPKSRKMKAQKKTNLVFIIVFLCRWTRRALPGTQ
jgi:hypothetical protein